MTIDEGALSRALRDAVTDPVVPHALASRVSAAHARRQRRRMAGAGVLSVALVAGVVVLVPAATRKTQPAASPYVGATGVVVAAPGRPARFCEPEPRADVAGAEPSPPDCRTYVVATGVDLARLADRRSTRSGIVWGGAWLAGTYADGTFRVVSQDRPRPAPSAEPTFPIPCAAPSGGWPVDPTFSLPPEGGPEGKGPIYLPPDKEPLTSWREAHPGEITVSRIGRSDPSHSVVVVAAVDPAVVEAALRPAYGDELCIVKSRYTAAEIEAAQADVKQFTGITWDLGVDPGKDGQPHVTLHVAIADTETDALVARHPKGLVVVEPWLAPVAAEEMAGRYVAANGAVIARPGQPMTFCEVRYRTATVRDGQHPPGCWNEVKVTGVDLDGLTSWTGELDGVRWGDVWVAGRYVDGTLHVSQQSPKWRSAERHFISPCEGSSPAPGPGSGESLDRTKAEQWVAAHPGEVVGLMSVSLDGGDRGVLVVGAIRPEVVHAGLRPVYGSSLCVVTSRYSLAEIAAALEDAKAFVRARSQARTELPDYERSAHAQLDVDDEFDTMTGQAYIEVHVPITDAESEALAARHPAGLIRLDPWLAPYA